MASDDPKSDSPFAVLQKMRDKLPPARQAREQSPKRPTARSSSEVPPEPAANAEPSAPQVSDAELFAREVAGARRIAKNFVPQRADDRAKVSVPDDDAEVMREIDDLIAGRSSFDFSFDDERIEGLAHGVNRKLLRQLSRGEFSMQASLDLHGKTRAEAKAAVKTFLRESQRAGKRCVLIVHGRGLHSEGQIPVLKAALAVWLIRSSMAKAVLAFCSARPGDGGAGAIYVMLRRL